MNSQKVAKWCHEFNAGKTDVLDNEGLVGHLL